MQRTLIAALAMSSALLLVGCEDEPEPRFEPTPSEATSSETPTEPTAVETTGAENETAEQFIRRWVDLIGKTQVTGDVDAYRAISAPNCRSCNSFVQRVESIYERGGFVQTDGPTITGLTHDVAHQWTVELNGAKTRYKNSADAKMRTLPGGPYSYVVHLVKSQGMWLLATYMERDL